MMKILSYFFTYITPAITAAFISGAITIFINKDRRNATKEINESNAKLTREINESNKKLKDRLSKDRIKADIISSARIKWVEEVREATIKYTNSIIKYSENYSDLVNQSEFIKSSYRMMLYFPGMSGSVRLKKSNKLLVDLMKKYTALRDKNDGHGEGEMYKKIKKHQKLSSDEKDFIESMYKFIGSTDFDREKIIDETRDVTNMFMNKMFVIDQYKIMSKKCSDAEIDWIITKTLGVISANLKIEWKRAENNE